MSYILLCAFSIIFSCFPRLNQSRLVTCVLFWPTTWSMRTTILDQCRWPILLVIAGPRSIPFSPVFCSLSHLCNVSVFILALLFLVLFLLFSSLFSFCFCSLPFYSFICPLPSSWCIRGCFIYSIRMQRGLGCACLTQKSISAQPVEPNKAPCSSWHPCALTKPNALISPLLPSLLGRHFVLTLPPLLSIIVHKWWGVNTAGKWVMVKCISLAAKWRKLKQERLSVCRYLFNDLELQFSLFLSVLLSFFLCKSSFPFLVLSLFFVCQRTTVLLIGCSYISQET